MTNIVAGLDNVRHSCLLGVLSILPRQLASEIERVCIRRADYPDSLSEIRVRCIGRCSLVISGENVPLFCSVSRSDMDTLFDKVIGSSIYAHTRELSEGFVTLEGGVRVGVCGALSENGTLPADVGGLVFRLPMGRCPFGEELLSLWVESGERGMLIYSLPGAGKTTALRALTEKISTALLKRVVVIDERCEFILSDYSAATVDILRGYGKAKGIEIAQRTLGAEVIVVDEIGSAEEGEALLRVGRGGVPVIATAHAATLDEVKGKCGIAPLIDEGYFGSFVRLFRDSGRFCFEGV